jgi:NhaP-type Na+/H+ or K+/H+ antiporter
VGEWGVRWFAADLVGRVAIAIAVGWVIGWILGRVSFRPPWKLTALADAQDGFVALAATLLAYGVTELARGYGFLAVFVAAVTMRDAERGHAYHRVLHNFAGQVEQVIVTVLLILLGGACATGVLADLTWRGALVSLALILVVRPLSGAVGLAGARINRRDRRAIGFFGIRGVGSAYYLAFAFGMAEFESTAELWAIVVFTILVSIVVHGVTATPVMELLDRRRSRRRSPRRSVIPRAAATSRRRVAPPR